MSRTDLDIIIPAAGSGRRMRSFGPKALISTGQESVLARQVRLLKAIYPHARVTVVVGFEADRMRRAIPPNVRAVVNQEYEETNVAFSLSLALAQTPPKRAALVIYGDLVFNGAITNGLLLDRSAVLVEQNSERSSEVGVNIVDDNALYFSHGLPIKWAQVAVLAPREKALFVELASSRFRRRHFTYEIFNEVLESGGSFLAVSNPLLRLVEIDSSKDIEKARQIDVGR